ncbi:MAG TPA: divalent-cation tolerance protein CutA [Burkholderiaceae bacterium]|jgi:periplasmic divalent cation tolerance protein|nr:divalent-cation tolerance protein CutA [Burkholderiaceae bacterium]
MEQVLLVMTNVPDTECAQALARSLLEQGLAACVNWQAGVKSCYRWQGAIEEASEVSVSIKTTASRYKELQAAIKALHPYEVPEIIAIPVVTGWEPYLAWVIEETKKEMND